MRSRPLFLLGFLLVACGGATVPAVPSATPLPALTARETTATPSPTTPATATALPPRSSPAPPAATPAPAPATATATAASLPTATRTPVAAPPVATPVPQPSGAVPAGWQVYRGPREFPIVIAYPPDWTVDDSLLPEQRAVALTGPGAEEGVADTVEIEGAAQPDDPNIDVLRDDFFYRKSAFCDRRGIAATWYHQVSGVPFSLLGADCDSSDALSYLQVASGVKDGDAWSVMLRTPYERKDRVVAEIFDPMLASLTIYALLPP